MKKPRISTFAGCIAIGANRILHDCVASFDLFRVKQYGGKDLSLL